MGQSLSKTARSAGHRRCAARRKLRDSGLRVTAQRLAVLAWLSAHPHASAEEVRTGVQEQLGSVSLQAIYGVLNTCVANDLVRRIDPAGSSGRFECRVDDNHHHVVCSNCGRIEDTDCVVDARPCLTPADDHGYAINEAEVVFWGVCPGCRAENGSEPIASHQPQGP